MTRASSAARLRERAQSIPVNSSAIDPITFEVVRNALALPPTKWR